MQGATEPHDGTARREHLTSVLEQEWADLARLLEQLAPDEWAKPTDLPGWDVRDNVAHLIGIEAMLLGEPEPPAPEDLARRPHVRNDLGASNEAWVEALRGGPVEQVLQRFRNVTTRRVDALRAMTDEDWGAPSWTPVGQADYGRFMQIRLFDTWFHDQDIRVATGRHGNLDGPAAAEALDEVVRALGYVVGKRAGAPEGSAVTFELTGPLRRDVHVSVQGRAAVVAGLDRPADATIRTDSATFMRLAGGRSDVRSVLDRLELVGDVELATQVVGNLGYVI